MKKIYFVVLVIAVFGNIFAKNPFIRHMYTADPTARVFNNTLYVYPSHDQDTATWFSMKDWHIFSTTDMVNWTDHGVALTLDSLKWAKSMAWAPDCIERNGKYYFYYPTDQSKIGVAVGNTPYGPFKDPLGSALIHIKSKGVICNRDFIDPAVFIDDDGQAYLYMGQWVVNAIKLNKDMISYDGTVYHLKGTDDFFEASWMHKYKGKYYLSYVGNSGEIKYCMSNSPLGPFEYKGVILRKMNSGTNHHSIAEFKGKWYMFYHNSDLYFENNSALDKKFGWGHEGSLHPFRRSICVDKLEYRQDGTIKEVIPTNRKNIITTNTINYKADFECVFSNPERGWHVRVDVDGRDKDDRDFKNVIADGHTLLHSYLRLDDFKEIDILPQSYLDKLQEALDTIRAQGLKIILRPTHVWSEKPTVPYERIFKHIDQLNAVISKNADVVNHLEVGYLGKWGEWHSGLYTELSNRADGDIRYKIIERILNTTPNALPIAMRYPMHLKEVLEVLPTPEGSKALTQVQKDRVGHHGDCFLYDDHDRGTYARLNIWFGDQTLEQQKEFTFNLATSYGGNKMMGGETCSSKIERIDDTQNDMAKANWTEINISFWENAIDMWKKKILPANGNDPQESEYNRISRKLGYRLRLVDATFPVSAEAGKNFAIEANINNDGFAGIIKKRPVFLVFDNGTNRYNIELTNVDVRTWLSGENKLTKQIVKLPKNMVPGTYNLALWLPDASENLQSKASYSVRFANSEMWDANKGYNILSNKMMVLKR